MSLSHYLAEMESRIEATWNGDTMPIETDTVDLPDHWATALINGNFSGLEDSDPAEAGFVRDLIDEYAADGWTFADCDSESRFTWHYGLYNRYSNASGGSVLEFTIIRSR
jgi:hypothetical protein